MSRRFLVVNFGVRLTDDVSHAQGKSKANRATPRPFASFDTEDSKICFRGLCALSDVADVGVGRTRAFAVVRGGDTGIHKSQITHFGRD